MEKYRKEISGKMKAYESDEDLLRLAKQIYESKK